MYILKLPTAFYQEFLYCWAAGASSWLRATGRGVATPEQLIARFADYTYQDDGTLPEDDGSSGGDNAPPKKGGMKKVFSELGVELSKISRSSFTYDYVLDKLKTKGHLLLLKGTGHQMGHTFVIYGVGYPDQDSFGVFDSLKGTGGFKNRSFSKIRNESTDDMYIGWAK